MTERYELNYDWHLLGPALSTEESTVTLQVDLHSYDGVAPVWDAVHGWWQGLEHVSDYADVVREMAVAADSAFGR